jgi:AraC-like DNA-binding protein
MLNDLKFPIYSDPWPRPTNFHVVTAATSLEAPGSTYGPWKMDRYGLAWIVEGSGVTHYDDEAFATQPGSVLMVRPGSVARHDWGNVRCFQCFVVFGFDELPAPWPDPASWPSLRNLPEDHLLFNLWRCLLPLDASDPKLSQCVVMLVELLLRVFVSEVETKPAAAAVPLPEAVERAIELIRQHVSEHPTEALRLPQLAQTVHVTPQHLCRLFKENLGLGPIECAQALRLDLASSLIERTELSLNEIAERYGFSSQFHFSKAFKQNYGMSPNAYRKSFRNGIVTRPAGLMFRNHPVRRYFYEDAPGKIKGSGGGKT